MYNLNFLFQLEYNFIDFLIYLEDEEDYNFSIMLLSTSITHIYIVI